MSIIETVSDVNNTFLSRRELTCNFAGLAGKLKKLEAVDMISKEFNLGDKVIIPFRLRNHSGKSIITGTFYVYDDEVLAKKHMDPTIFSRLERSKAKKDEPEKVEETPAKSEKVEETPAKSEKVEETPLNRKDAKSINKNLTKTKYRISKFFNSHPSQKIISN